MTTDDELGAALRRYERRRAWRHKWRTDAGKTHCLRCGEALRPGVDAENMCSATRPGALDFTGRRLDPPPPPPPQVPRAEQGLLGDVKHGGRAGGPTGSGPTGPATEGRQRQWCEHCGVRALTPKDVARALGVALLCPLCKDAAVQRFAAVVGATGAGCPTRLDTPETVNESAASAVGELEPFTERERVDELPEPQQPRGKAQSTVHGGDG